MRNQSYMPPSNMCGEAVEYPCALLFRTICWFAGECEGEGKSGGSCEGYEPILNSRGKDVVIGTAVFEGYLAGVDVLTRILKRFTVHALLGSSEDTAVLL